MKKVRNIRWHTALIDTLKTETSNFVPNLILHWKPVVCSEQCCCTCMPGLTEDKSGCMILYALKLIQFVVRDISKVRMREAASLLAASVDRKERGFFSSAKLTEQNAAQVFNLCIHGQRFI